MNHRVNARVHKLPKCDECGARAEEPCVTAPGLTTEREPHEIRLKVKRGDVFVVSAEDARAARKLRTIQELVELIHRRVLKAAGA
jgi:hypothetical protein